MASRYLSVDEGIFSDIAVRWDVSPVEIGTETRRWRKTDLDKLIKRLPADTIWRGRQGKPRNLEIDKAVIEKLAAAVARRLENHKPARRPALVSISDATNLLGVGRSTVYRLIENGGLNSRKIGRRTLIPMADIDRILLQH